LVYLPSRPCWWNSGLRRAGASADPPWTSTGGPHAPPANFSEPRASARADLLWRKTSFVQTSNRHFETGIRITRAYPKTGRAAGFSPRGRGNTAAPQPTSIPYRRWNSVWGYILERAYVLSVLGLMQCITKPHCGLSHRQNSLTYRKLSLCVHSPVPKGHTDRGEGKKRSVGSPSKEPQARCTSIG